MDSKKSNKIREIVRLQQILKKWRKLANNNNNASSKTSGSKGIKFLKRTLSLSDTSSSSSSGFSSSIVPKGYLAVSVGEEQKRFVIPMQYLGHQAFQILLREAEEEFGFQQTGVLRLPCEVYVFEKILKMVEEKSEVSKFFMQECRFSVDDLVGCCSSEESQVICSSYHHPESPMCR